VARVLAPERLSGMVPVTSALDLSAVLRAQAERDDAEPST